MDSFSSSAEVNTNIADNSSESKDLGQEFLAQTPIDSTADDSAPKLVNDYYCHQFLSFGQPFITCEGYISMVLLKDIRVDVNSNHSICVTTSNSKVGVDYLGQNIGVIHPYGRVFQETNPSINCHIESGTHLAKICSRGVTFTSLNRSLIYLVDNSGCKTTTERFRKLNYDFTAEIFHSNSLTGEYARQRSFADLSTYDVTEDGSDKIWYLAGLRIRQNVVTGDVMISKSYGKIVINISPNKNQMKVNAPNLRIMATHNPDCLLQVIKPHSRDEQRVVANLDQFTVKYGSQKAGFDASDQLILM